MHSGTCAVVIPVGPNAKPGELAETIDSVNRFVKSAHIVLIDNTVSGLKKWGDWAPCPIRILRYANSGGHNPTGILAGIINHAYGCLVRDTTFDILLRLDDDALAIAEGVDEDARRAFRANSDLGSLAAYRMGPAGPRSFDDAARMIGRELSRREALMHPLRFVALARLLRAAKANGYQMGEHGLGAAVFYTRNAVEAMCKQGYLAAAGIRASNLCEDHLFGMAIRAAGCKVGEFAAEGLPLGVTYRGLAFPPEEMLRRGKKIVHTLKDAGGDQASARQQYRSLDLRNRS